MFARVVHELATNATKLRCTFSARLEVSDVQWAVRDDVFSFSWVERDGPPVSQPATSGFGSKLICTAFGESPRISYLKMDLNMKRKLGYRNSPLAVTAVLDLALTHVVVMPGRGCHPVPHGNCNSRQWATNRARSGCPSLGRSSWL